MRILFLLILTLLPVADVYAGKLLAISKSEATAFLKEWVKVQNEADVEHYAALYASDFTGLRRSGKAAERMNREQWLKDRGRMFNTPMQVGTDQAEIRVDTGLTTIRFVQRWSTGKFADVGVKQMSLRRTSLGTIEILGEEMTCSLLLRRNGRPVVYASSEDRAEAQATYPAADVQSLPAQREGDCSAGLLNVWVFKVRYRVSFTGEGGTYEVFEWQDSDNHAAKKVHEQQIGLGTVILRDGKPIKRFDLGDCEPPAMFAIPGGVVLPLTTSYGAQGIFQSSLIVFRIEADRVSEVATIPVVANDSLFNDTYSYKASVEYRDVSGNGVPDIIVTPIERRRVGAKYPKDKRVIIF